MLKIGDFSRLSQVSVKTLRYYDEVGLLKPTQVDQVSGYRYYSVVQLRQLHRILALVPRKELLTKEKGLTRWRDASRERQFSAIHRLGLLEPRTP
jgi:MerR-like DNA binding protein